MNLPNITDQLLRAKKQKGLSFADLEKILGRDEVWIAALFYRQAKRPRGREAVPASRTPAHAATAAAAPFQA